MAVGKITFSEKTLRKHDRSYLCSVLQLTKPTYYGIVPRIPELEDTLALLIGEFGFHADPRPRPDQKNQNICRWEAPGLNAPHKAPQGSLDLGNHSSQLGQRPPPSIVCGCGPALGSLLGSHPQSFPAGSPLHSTTRPSSLKRPGLGPSLTPSRCLPPGTPG